MELHGVVFLAGNTPLAVELAFQQPIDAESRRSVGVTSIIVISTFTCPLD